MKLSKTRKTLIAIAVVLALFLLLSFLGREQRPSWEYSNPMGTRGRLEAGTLTEIPLCKTERDLTEMSGALNGHDNQGFHQMVIGGRIFYAESGSSVKVIGEGLYGMRQIELMDGRKGWVLARLIK